MEESEPDSYAKITLCCWNINGFSKWKGNHNDIIALMKHDISLLIETWLTDPECELIKQTVSKDVGVDEG